MQRGLGVPGHPGQDLLVGLHPGAGRQLTRVVVVEGRLGQDLPGDTDRLHPFPLVGRRGQVVEPQRRVDRRVGRGDLAGAAGVGVHRADVHLVPVPRWGLRAVVADRDGQEVEHQVRVDHVVVAAGEATALEVVGGTRPRPPEQPLRADHGAVAPFERGRDRDRQLRAVLDVHLQVVLQVLAHAGQVGDHVDAERGELRGGADAG